MEHKPATTYIVSVFEKPHWRRLLTTKDKAQAEALEQAMIQDGVKAIEEICTASPACVLASRHISENGAAAAWVRLRKWTQSGRLPPAYIRSTL